MSLRRSSQSPEESPGAEPDLECFEAVSFMDFPNDAANPKNDPLCGNHSSNPLGTCG